MYIYNKMNKLFGTFANIENYKSITQQLLNNFSIINNIIFVVGYELNNVICTYNLDHNNLKYLPINTVSIHRKKESNTLYTINALNTLNGTNNKEIEVKWELYKNKFLLIQKEELKIYDIKLIEVIR